MGTPLTKTQDELSRILYEKQRINNSPANSRGAIDWNIWKTPCFCPKCKTGLLIVKHMHTKYVGPVYKKMNDGDVFNVCCNNPECNYYDTAFIDTPDTPEAAKQGYERPKKCPITGMDISDENRIYNNSQV